VIRTPKVGEFCTHYCRRIRHTVYPPYYGAIKQEALSKLIMGQLHSTCGSKYGSTTPQAPPRTSAPRTGRWKPPPPRCPPAHQGLAQTHHIRMGKQSRRGYTGGGNTRRMGKHVHWGAGGVTHDVCDLRTLGGNQSEIIMLVARGFGGLNWPREVSVNQDIHWLWRV
jgi:hypothetical protein